MQRGKPPEWWEKQKGSRGIRRGQWYRLVFQFPIRELVADDLEHGKLIRVLQRYSLRMEGLFLYYPHRNVSPALRMVIDTLKI
ncbi:hypothetical protein B6Q68_24250 [Escherichia coli]|nr:hypothetical protein [Escherichia coli]EFO2492140.1 hypothetical protein [Escherichia coli]EFO2612548.1 hypothetical protein [Escherichia coli]